MRETPAQDAMTDDGCPNFAAGAGDVEEHTIHLWVTTGLQILLAIGLAGSAYGGAWLNVASTAGVLALSLIPRTLGRRFSVYIPPEFEFAAVLFLFASLFLGDIHGFYLRFWWWDLLLHSISGCLLGLAGFLFLFVLNEEERIGLHMKPGFVALFSFTFALAAGALWEIFEFAVDAGFQTAWQHGLPDTMGDLCVDAAGALGVCVLGYFFLRRGSESFIESRLLSFARRNPRLFKPPGAL